MDKINKPQKMAQLTEMPFGTWIFGGQIILYYMGAWITQEEAV